MSVSSTPSQSSEIAEGYTDLEKAVFRSLPPSAPLFQTDASEVDLWSEYLNGITPSRRQYYTCTACRHFIQRYGGLVTLLPSGVQASALWAVVSPGFFHNSISALRYLANNSKITGVFLSADKILGAPLTNKANVRAWTHLAAHNPNPYAGGLLSASQAMAEKVEDYKMLCHGLADYSYKTVEQAVRVLKADAVERSEKALGIAEWFLKLHTAIRDNPKAKRNLTWLAVALAPPGFCHIRSTMISTLLDDITSGLAFEDIAARWKTKMHPLQYQRPTAAPKEGAIKQAEETVKKLGLERSLLRRYATLDDILVKLWVPRELPVTESSKKGVFDDLRKIYAGKQPSMYELPSVTLTWEKFKRTVLGSVLEMEIFCPAKGGYCGLLTAVDYDAPPILQWDGLEGYPRNPVSWYFWHGGSLTMDWMLAVGWNKVTCIFPSPAKWQKPDGFKHQQDRIHFAIAGCVELRPLSLALFPENLRSELHGVRSVIEAHSNAKGAEGAELGTANGLTLDDNNKVQLRVRTAEGYANYVIDRMD